MTENNDEINIDAAYLESQRKHREFGEWWDSNKHQFQDTAMIISANQAVCDTLWHLYLKTGKLPEIPTEKGAT